MNFATSTPPGPSIAILGTPVSSGNRGVLALGASLVALCCRVSPTARISLLIGHHDNTAVSFRVNSELRQFPVVNCRLSPRSRLQDHLAWIVLMSCIYRILPIGAVRRRIASSTPWIGAVERADVVGDIRGGDSFSDIYGMKRFLLGFLQAWSVILVKGKMVQFPQTFGPFRNPLAARLAGYLIRKSSIVVARDKQSLEVARQAGGGRKNVSLCCDVAFSLGSAPPARIAVEPSAPAVSHEPAGHIGLNVNGLLFNGGYSRNNMFGLRMDYATFLSKLIRALLELHPGEVWLTPHTFAPDDHVESDPAACHVLRSGLRPSLRSRVRIVAKDYDPYEIKGVIGQYDFFIGSRMHACIAALSQGVPCVGVAYSRKFFGVFESVGMEGWVVDARLFNDEEAVARIVDLYSRRDSIRSTLKTNVASAETQLLRVFSQIIEARP